MTFFIEFELQQIVNASALLHNIKKIMKIGQCLGYSTMHAIQVKCNNIKCFPYTVHYSL